MNKNICVVGGAGYVGLITGIGLACLGNRVINVDVNSSRVKLLSQGNSPLYEENLEETLRQELGKGSIRFSTDLQEAVRASDIIFIAVGTPSLADGQADLRQVIQVANDLTKYIDSYKLIINKSTVPVGTLELVREILIRGGKSEGTDFDLVSNPEFLREGKGLYDFFHPDRIVIGANSTKAANAVQELYEPLSERQIKVDFDNESTSGKQIPIVQTDIASAQMIKYAANAFLATRISFINEIAGLCERVGADVEQVAKGMGYDSRIGHAYLDAGMGFGGPCLEKDLLALMKISESFDFDTRVLREVLIRNDKQVRGVVSRLKEVIEFPIYNKIIAVLGLAFKKGTNDVRNSLTLRVIDQLEGQGALIHGHDPVAAEEAAELRPTLKLFDDPYEAITGADAVVITTDWDSFKELDYARLKELMESPSIVDGRNLLDPEEMKALGFAYRSFGRGAKDKT
jgi:UDPglucose 6-dehydrogenase